MSGSFHDLLEDQHENRKASLKATCRNSCMLQGVFAPCLFILSGISSFPAFYIAFQTTPGVTESLRESFKLDFLLLYIKLSHRTMFKNGQPVRTFFFAPIVNKTQLSFHYCGPAFIQ